MNGQLERDLSEGLRSLADHAPAGNGWDGIQRRVAQRRRLRRLQRTALASLLVLGAAGGLASVVASDGARQVVAGPSGEAAAGLRYVADVPGFVPLSASESTESSPPATIDDGTLMVLTRADAGFSGPVLFVRTVPAGVNYGFGEGNPEAVTADVQGRTGFLYQTSPVSRSLGWMFADGSGVHLVSVGLTQDALLAAARAVTVDGGRVTWTPGSLPAQLELRRTTRAGQESSSASAEVSYRGPRTSFAVQIKAGGDHLVDTYIADRAGAAREVSEVKVDGQPAVLSTYDKGERRSLIWAVRPGVVAEIDAVDMSDAEVVAVAEAIRPARDDEWAQLLALARGPSAAERSNDAAITMLNDTRCQVRAEWLAAHARGNAGEQRAAAGKLADLIARQRAAGVQPNGDIFLVVDRLVRAMQAGDVAGVEAQACN